MPTVNVNGVDLFYEATGGGAETVVFSHSYLLDSSHFRPQIDSMSSSFRCVAFDHRGHGRSAIPRSGYDMENLYTDAIAFIEAIADGPCHFVGLSTGGYIGVRMGFRRPDLLKSLVLMDTSADLDPPGQLLQYKVLLLLARFLGPSFVAKQAFPFLFGESFRRDISRTEEAAAWLQKIASNDRRAAVAFGNGIFGRKGVFEQIGDIAVPTLVVVGEEDLPTPVDSARRLAERIPGAELQIIPNAGHICTIENPDVVTNALTQFIRSHC